MPKYDKEEILEQASGKWIEILEHFAGEELAEALKVVGKHVDCPFHPDGDDRDGTNDFRLDKNVDINGKAYCTCGTFDGFEMVKRANGWGFAKILEEISKFLGNEPMDRKKRKPTREEIKRNQKNAAERAEEQRIKTANIERSIQKILDTCSLENNDERPLEYFRYRGIDMNELPETIYYHPDLIYREDNEDGSDIETILYLPALVCLYQKVNDEVVNIHRIYLSKNSKGKANVKAPKKMYASIYPSAQKGAAIRLDPAAKRLAVVEGVETGMAVRYATGLSTWVAGNTSGMKSLELPKTVKEVLIWADNDQSDAGMNAALVLTERLLREGREVAILLPDRPDDERNWDWLDELNQNGVDALKKIANNPDWYELDENEPAYDVKTGKKLKDKTKTSEITNQEIYVKERSEDFEEAMKFLNAKHFVVTLGGETYIATESIDPVSEYMDVEFGKVQGLKLRYNNWYVGEDKKNQHRAVDLWLSYQNRRQYEKIIFAPGVKTTEHYNLFQGFPINGKKGDCSLFWNHVRDNICKKNETFYKFVRKWMAQLIQKPAEVPGTALVLRGEQGTGKNFFVDCFGKIVGKYYFQAQSMKHVTGHFNAHLKNVLLLNANEALWGGNKKEEGVLKALVTDDLVPIEHKGVDVIMVRNYKRLIVTSNENWAVPVGIGDRRFLTLDVSSNHKEDYDYFSKIDEMMKNGGYEALMYDLENEDLSTFNHRKLPKGATDIHLVLKSSPPIYSWWHEILESGENRETRDKDTGNFWQELIPKQELFTLYIEWCKTNSQRHHEIASEFGKNLKPLIGVTGPMKDYKKKVSGYNDRVSCYLLPPLKECRKIFENLLKLEPTIWPQEEMID